jgi:hypothetical protein
MRTRLWSVALAVAVIAGLSGCVPGSGLPQVVASASPVGGVETPTDSAAAEPSGSLEPSPAATIGPGQAPTATYAVGVRQLDVTRANRPLGHSCGTPDPAALAPDPRRCRRRLPARPVQPRADLEPRGVSRRRNADRHGGLRRGGPAYPFTNSAADPYNPADLINQPADGSAVITAVLALNNTAGDPLAGHLDAARVAAAGHSAGAYTTVGLLSGARDDRLRAAIVIAGGSLGGAFTGPAASVLFVHGDKDPVVSYPIGQATYQLVPWPRAFLTVVNGDHSSYLYAPTAAASAVSSTMLDFLRWALYGDQAAKARMPAEATIRGATIFESTL